MIIPRRLVQQKDVPVARDESEAAGAESIAKHDAQGTQPQAQIDATHEGVVQCLHPIEEWKVTVLWFPIAYIQLTTTSLLGYVNQHGGTVEHAEDTQGGAIYRTLQPTSEAAQIPEVLQIVAKADFEELVTW